MYKVFSIKSALLLAAACLLLAVIAVPALSFGAELPIKLSPDCDATLAPGDPAGPNGPPCNISAFIIWVKTLIRYMFIIAVPIATAFIVWGAFVMMKSGGNPGEFEKGKKVVYSAIIGIIIMFTANLIVSTIVNALKGATS